MQLHLHILSERGNRLGAFRLVSVLKSKLPDLAVEVSELVVYCVGGWRACLSVGVCGCPPWHAMTLTYGHPMVAENRQRSSRQAGVLQVGGSEE